MFRRDYQEMTEGRSCLGPLRFRRRREDEEEDLGPNLSDYNDILEASSSMHSDRRSTTIERYATTTTTTDDEEEEDDEEETSSSVVENDEIVWESAESMSRRSSPSLSPNLTISTSISSSMPDIRYHTPSVSPTSSKSPLVSLLTLPTPEDRSYRRRIEYEQHRRRLRADEREYEPAGRYGQDASEAILEEELRRDKYATLQPRPRLYSGPDVTATPSLEQLALIPPPPPPPTPPPVKAQRTKTPQKPRSGGKTPQRTRSSVTFQDQPPMMETPRHANVSQRHRQIQALLDEDASSQSTEDRSYTTRFQRQENTKPRQSTPGRSKKSRDKTSPETTKRSNQSDSTMRQSTPGRLRSTVSELTETTTKYQRTRAKTPVKKRLEQSRTTKTLVAEPVRAPEASGMPRRLRQKTPVKKRVAEQRQNESSVPALTKTPTFHQMPVTPKQATPVSPDPTVSTTEMSTPTDGSVAVSRVSSEGSDKSLHNMSKDFMALSDVGVISEEDIYTRGALTLGHATDNVSILNQLAMEHIQNSEFDMALAAFQQVLEIQKKKNGDIHPTVASAYHNLGTVHAKRASVMIADSAQQRHCRALALECFQEAARTARHSLGPVHPNVAVSLVRIGLLLQESRQYQNAMVTFKEALRLRLTIYGVRHKLVANLYNNLGLCSMHLGDFEQGQEYLEAAVLIQRDVVAKSGGDQLNQDKLELADSLFNIGGLCMEWIRRGGPNLKRAIDAEEAFAEALEIRTHVLGPNDKMVAQVRSLLDMARAVPVQEKISLRSRSEQSQRDMHMPLMQVWSPKLTKRRVSSFSETGQLKQPETPLWNSAAQGPPVDDDRYSSEESSTREKQRRYSQLQSVVGDVGRSRSRSSRRTHQ